MRVRDALERDARELSGLTRIPRDVMREIIHDRTIRVAERSAADGDESDIVGFVGFDAEREAVHVTHLAGDETAFRSLLAEPVRFARTVELPVRMLVPETEDALRTTVEEFGFEADGFGPQFDGTPTRKYRFD